MRAVHYLGPKVLELRKVPIPIPGSEEVLVKIRAATTCGTDVKTYLRGHPKFPPPFVFGHEFGGDVVEVGRDVRNVQSGARITANVFAECGSCFYCERGQGNICENLIYNFGAFAEYMIVPEAIVRKNLFEIPEHISYAEAALLEPLVSVVHGQGLVNIQPGETVAIIGAGGPIGLLHLQLVLRAGANQVIAIDLSDSRREIAQELGATTTINPRQADVDGVIRDLTSGVGADVVIESVGTKDTWEISVKIVRKGGRVLWFGGPPGGTIIELDSSYIHYGEITLLNTHGGTAEEARSAFEMICSGAVDVKPLLTDEYPLERVEDALKRMIVGEAVKIAINPLLSSA
jgi:L-iditol 2-dehydrogenase